MAARDKPGFRRAERRAARMAAQVHHERHELPTLIYENWRGATIMRLVHSAAECKRQMAALMGRRTRARLVLLSTGRQVGGVDGSWDAPNWWFESDLFPGKGE